MHVFIKSPATVEIIDGEEYTGIDDMNGLHRTIAQAVVDSRRSLTHEEFKFLRIELNVSQKMLGTRFGVSAVYFLFSVVPQRGRPKLMQD